MSNMLKITRKFVSENVYVFLGIIIGLYMSSFISTSLDISCDTDGNPFKVNSRLAQEIINSSINKLEPRILPEKKKGETKSNFVRPRYYSTELGIKEKLFVGIFTSEDKVNTQAVHINKTIGHIVDKIKFFITAQYKLKSKFNLTGLVGFTDARSKYRPFQVIKYVADTFVNDYDYFFFANDYTFINAHKLKAVVSKISISMDLYLGSNFAESSYCNLDAGVVISNSVLKAARENLEWCIINAVTDDYSENLGRCIFHSIGLSCQNSVQDQSLPSYKLKHFDLPLHLKELSETAEFNSAITVRPVISNEDFFRLNAYFLKQRLEMLNKQVLQISRSLPESWPPGQRPGALPATRFDMPRQYYFNLSHVFFPDDFTVLRQHSDAELLDIENIIAQVVSEIEGKYPKAYEFRRLVNGYKTFDLSRGLDYTLDMGLRDLSNGKEVVKRFEVSKPLGSVEFIPVPYVTENTRVSIILPVQETEVIQSMNFLSRYDTTIMEKKEKTLLFLVFLYQYNSNSKGSEDPFKYLKQFVKDATARHANDDVKMSWLSIRLPESKKVPIQLEDKRALNFAIVDLSLKKIGLDSLTLVLDVWANITVDFLNRVRMNTIENYQVYSPIPFTQYNPQVSQLPNLEVNKMSGHFDREEYKYIAFYGKDYVTARKRTQKTIPLIRVDNDIVKLVDSGMENRGNLFEMFVRTSPNLHCMRATEMNLKVLYHFEKSVDRVNKFYGNEAQLAKLLLTKQEMIPELL